MENLERVMAAVNGVDTDYQPFTLMLSLYGASMSGSKIDSYYRKPNEWFEGQKMAIQAFDPDIVIAPFSLPIEAEAFGSEITFLQNYAPNVRKPVLNSLEGVKKLQVPTIETSSSLQFLLNCTDLLRKQYGGKRAIAAPINSPADLPALLMGLEMWIDTILFHPIEFECLMQKTIEHFVNLGNEYLKRGATFLVLPLNVTSSSIITDRMFKNILPYLEEAFQQINGPIVIHNGGTKLMPFIEQFSKLPNVIAFVIDAKDIFSEARRKIGDQMVLMGNLDGPSIINLSIDKIKEKTLKILNDRKHDKHFVFATSNADIPYDTPIEKISAMVETVKSFKKA